MLAPLTCFGISTYIHIYAFVYAHAHVCAYQLVSLFEDTTCEVALKVLCVSPTALKVGMHTFVYIYIYMCINIYIYMCINIYIYVYIYIHLSLKLAHDFPHPSCQVAVSRFDH